MATHTESHEERAVRIVHQNIVLDGDLTLIPNPQGVVLFAHGSGSSRHSARNRWVAGILRLSGFATLLMDLLTRDEEQFDNQTRELRFDIEQLARRLVSATDWLQANESTRDLPIGYFGASTGAAAALVAAVDRANVVAAVVSRGGRPDLAARALPLVHAPTLLIVGSHDFNIIPLNQKALEQIESSISQMEIVPNATHLFEESGALEQVATLASDWFTKYLRARSQLNDSEMSHAIHQNP